MSPRAQAPVMHDIKADAQLSTAEKERLFWLNTGDKLFVDESDLLIHINIRGAGYEHWTVYTLLASPKLTVLVRPVAHIIIM